MLQKINNAEEMFSVPTMTTRVQAGNQNPAQMVLGIPMKRLFIELGTGLKKPAKDVEAPGTSIRRLEEQREESVIPAQQGLEPIRSDTATARTEMQTRR